MWREMTDREFEGYRLRLHDLSGIHLPDDKRVLLTNRLKGRLRETGVRDHTAYLARVTTDPREAQRFVNAVTTNETYFFRCHRHWEFLRGALAAHAAEGGGDLALWSAATSTGAEAHTMAICLLEALGPGLGGRRAVILGTDINDEVLESARAGVYGPYALAQMDESLIPRHFESLPDRLHRVRPELRRLCTFERHNLLESLDRGPFDVVFLRNVMIYFDLPTRERVLRRVHEVLRPGGWLVVGESESLVQIEHGLRYVQPSIFARPAADGTDGPSPARSPGATLTACPSSPDDPGARGGASPSSSPDSTS